MTSETQGGQRIINKPGLYRHPETGVEIQTQMGAEGFIQADAAVQVGFRYVNESEAKETKTPKTSK
jgi:hypothetical protein